MPITPPGYPAVLTKKNWDANKGVLAKMAGFTGVGDALTDLEKAYKKVDWKELDMTVKFPPGDKAMTLPVLKKAVDVANAAVKSGDCGKLHAEALKARDLAKQVGNNFKANRLVPKSATALCESIVKAADLLSVECNVNTMGTKIGDTAKEVTAMFDATAQNIAKNYKTHVSKLKPALAGIARDPTWDAWRDAGIMTLARNLNQQIGNVTNLAAKGYDVGMDAHACDAVFKDLNLYARVDVPFKQDADETERKRHLKELLTILARAETLQP